MAHGVGRELRILAGGTHAFLEYGTQGIGGHGVAARREEERPRGLGGLREAGTRTLEVGAQTVEDLRVERHDPLLAPLSEEPDLRLGEIDVLDGEARDLRDAGARGVEELEDRSIAQTDLVGIVDSGEDIGDIAVRHRLGKRACDLGARDGGCGILRHKALMNEPAVERADGGEVAVHGLLGVARTVEVGEVGAQLAVADGRGEHALALGPGGEGCEVGAVGADRLRREPADILQI